MSTRMPLLEGEEGWTVTERLTDMESKYLMLSMSGITTITIFRGDPSSACQLLQTRFVELLQHNPWLAGSLVTSDGVLGLQYESVPSLGDIGRLFNPTHRGGKPASPPALSSVMDMGQLCRAVSNSTAVVLPGTSCVDNLEPLVALSVIPDQHRPVDTFAVVFSLSHAIADGFTYYMLLSMLSNTGSMVRMSPTRKCKIDVESIIAIGEEERDLNFSKAAICNTVCRMLCGSKPTIGTYYVHPDRIKAAKSATTHPDVAFLSTNDVITSSFGLATSARIMFMALNFRNKLPGYIDTDAGNYEGMLVFGPEDYEDPTMIRRTLQSGPPAYVRGAGDETQPLPGCWESMRSGVSLVSNWTFPCFSELVVAGCQQMVHVPHLDEDKIFADIALIYRPRAGELAMAFFVRRTDKEGLVAECPLGEAVGTAEDCNEALRSK